MDASNLPKGQSKEVYSDGRPINLPGIYVHEKSGNKIITANGDEGVTQADAIVRSGGYERVGDVPTGLELKAMNKAQEIKDAAAEALQKGQEAADLKAAVKEAVKAADAVTV